MSHCRSPYIFIPFFQASILVNIVDPYDFCDPTADYVGDVGENDQALRPTVFVTVDMAVDFVHVKLVVRPRYDRCIPFLKPKPEHIFGILPHHPLFEQYLRSLHRRS